MLRALKRHSGKKEKPTDFQPSPTVTEDEGTEKMIAFIRTETDEEGESSADLQNSGSSHGPDVQPSSLATGLKGDSTLPSNLASSKEGADSNIRAEKFSSVKYVSSLDILACPEGKISYFWIKLIESCTGTFLSVPVLVARGCKPGPVLGMVAAIHGEEVNGTPLIHAVFNHLRDRLDTLCGTVVGVPVANIPAYNLRRRVFPDQSRDVDLNRLFPGKIHGSTAEKYAYYLFTKVIVKFDYCLDVHTACFGNLNCCHIRADLSDPRVENMAKILNGDVILHSKGPTGGHPEQGGTSLRAAAASAGIPSVCIEIADANFHETDAYVIGKVFAGVYRLLIELRLDTRDARFEKENSKLIVENKKKAVLCKRSYWLFTDHGGLLTVHTKLLQRIKQGEHIATITNLFGFVLQKMLAPEDGIVIGQSQGPVKDAGARILHFGVVAPNEDWLPVQSMVQAAKAAQNPPSDAASPVSKRGMVPSQAISPISK
eukprot:gb/GEZN01005694.1/.p1 GENE.gb/GEZN01005694.1/~~gb/GEZN01005694.1/.p1  ORF type:complete len:486 (-),score=73.82 gb/GEZN01005694.1/:285-1742(-)